MTADISAIRTEARELDSLLELASKRLNEVAERGKNTDESVLQIKILQLSEIRMVQVDNCSATLEKMRAMATEMGAGQQLMAVIENYRARYTQIVNRCTEMQKICKDTRELLHDFFLKDNAISDWIAEQTRELQRVRLYDEELDDLSNIFQGSFSVLLNLRKLIIIVNCLMPINSIKITPIF